MTLGALPLPGKGANLALHFANHIVETRQIQRSLLEAPLRAATTIAVEADTGSLLE
jgi:hypothetical protein